MNNFLIIFFILLINNIGVCQYFPPEVGKDGTTAIYKDSADFLGWATKISINRGPMDISNLGLGLATFGEPNFGLGPADGKVISLGDGGEAIVQFETPISNGSGPDFAVFENSFNNTFLEFAFVEVSSDGIRFVRFPATSLSQNTVQFGNDAIIDPTNINNLAGKYKASYGTPFDLDELKDSVGIDLESISHVKLLDVVGSIDKLYGSKDIDNHLINDPFPTPYPSSGFDLDAIGVINSNKLSISEITNEVNISPNPTNGIVKVKINNISIVELVDAVGVTIEDKRIEFEGFFDLIQRPKGIYFLRIEGSLKKIILY